MKTSYIIALFSRKIQFLIEGVKVSVFAVYIEYNRPQPLCGLGAAHDSNQVFQAQTHLNLVWLEMSRTAPLQWSRDPYERNLLESCHKYHKYHMDIII